MKRLDRPLSVLLAVVMATLPVLLPLGEARAAGGQFKPRWTSWPVSATTSVRYPLDNWSLLGEIAGRGAGGFDLRMLQGERWITAGREEVGQLGLNSEAVSKLVSAFPGHAAVVFATYSPENAQLRIRIVKAERQADGRLRSLLGDFTPHHGARWAAQRHYLTADERVDTTRPGRNPFASFRSADETDPVFYNVGWSAAQVAVGHAMRLYNASAGFIALTDTRWTQRVSRSGNLFRQRVDVTTEAWVRPRWFVALPLDHQPYGMQAAICTIPGSTSCPALELLAHSGVSVAQWEGGNMPSPEELLYAWTDSQSGFTVFSFALLTGALVWGVATLAITAGQFSAASLMASGVALTPGSIAGLAAGGYSAASTLFGGGGPITSAQQGYLGATGSGFLEVSATTNPHAAAAAAEVIRRQVSGTLNRSLAGTRTVYSGDCPEGSSIQNCRDLSLDPGRMPRQDSVVPQNIVGEARDRFESCRARGLRDGELMRCAALESR